MPSNKTEQSIYECLLGFCFNNIFCAATNLQLHRQFFFCPIPESRKMMVMVSTQMLLLPVCLNSKRLLGTSCNKQGQRSSE